MRPRRNFLRSAAVACALIAVLPAWSRESAYPSRPVTIVVPFPAGGVVDIIARIVAEKMATAMKATFIVENRVGAGGTIGATMVATAQPDGYTLLLGGSATHIFGPLLYRNLPYDPMKSFVPIGQITSSPLVVVVGANTQASSVPELIALFEG